MERKVDSVTLSVIAGRLEATTRQMTVVVSRTARSVPFKYGNDFSNTIFDSQGRQVVQGEDEFPVHLGSMPTAMKNIIEYFGDDIHDGDIIAHNDPASGGAHLQDVLLAAPLFIDGELMFWVGCKGHHMDTGGMMPGGYQTLAEEIYQEGLRITPLKIFDGGKERKDVTRLILANWRYPEIQHCDIEAQLASLRVAMANLRDLVHKYGRQTVKDSIEEMMGMGERRMREAIRKWPDGVYKGVSWLEGVHGLGDLELKVKVTIEGDSITVDWNTPPQVPAYLNSYWGNTLSFVYHIILVSARLAPPFNEGCYRPIKVNFGPLGTIANATLPAACSNSTTTPAQNFGNAVRVALSQAIPKEDLHAGWTDSINFTSTGIDPRSGKRYTHLHGEAVRGGAGATWGADGLPWLHTEVVAGAMICPEIEDIESESPFLIHYSQFRTDSGGAGRWRGGVGSGCEIEYLNHKTTLAPYGTGFKYAPPSVGGAESKIIEPKLSSRYVLRGEEKIPVKSGSQIEVDQGERFVVNEAGGGGVGDPFERDLEAVRMDVINEVVSIEGAREEYGVVIDPKTLEVNYQETAKLRSEKHGL